MVMEPISSSMGVPAIKEITSNIRYIAAIETMNSQPRASTYQTRIATQNQIAATTKENMAPKAGTPKNFKGLNQPGQITKDIDECQHASSGCHDG